MADDNGAVAHLLDLRRAVVHAEDRLEFDGIMRMRCDVSDVVDRCIGVRPFTAFLRCMHSSKERLSCNVYLCTSALGKSDGKFWMQVGWDNSRSADPYSEHCILGATIETDPSADGADGAALVPWHVSLQRSFCDPSTEDYMGTLPTETIRGLETVERAFSCLGLYWAGRSAFSSIEKICQYAMDLGPELAIHRKRVIKGPPERVVWEVESSTPLVKSALKEGQSQMD